MKTTIGILIGILFVGVLVFIARPEAKNNLAIVSANNDAHVLSGVGGLEVEGPSNYDFGRISMRAGKVSRQFKITNGGSEPAVISKIFTSCMCTAALLMKGEEKFGPYGMPGHVAVPTINVPLDSNEEAVVEVVFDPAAHGPAGVGRIQRTVTVENNGGQPIILSFVAVVTP